MKRSRIKITPVLITLNIFVIFIIIAFYSIRLVKYYLIENGSSSDDGSVMLVDELIKKQSYVDLTSGLIYDENNNIYRFKGNVDNNYILYSGILYRILEIDSANNIKAISDKSLTLMYSGLEKGYKNSYINKWLNKSDEKYSGIFESTMVDSDKYITNTFLCLDNVDDLTKIDCKENDNDNNITLLSLYDYANALGKESFINNGEIFYLSSLDKDGNNYYITSEGDVSLNKSSSKIFGVRPVVSFSSNTEILDGNGSLENPYIIEKHDIKKLSDTYVGDYIEFSDNLFKVVSKEDDSVRIVSNDAIKKDDEYVKINFDSSTNSYSIDKTKIGSYLNNDYLDPLHDKNFIVKSKWYIGSYSLNNLDYTNKYNSEHSTYMGMLGLGDLFINDVNNVLTITKGIESNNIIDVILEDGNVFGDLITSSYYVRPVVNLKNDLFIISGNGRLDSPYKLGVEKNG